MSDRIETTEQAVAALLEPCRVPMMRATIVAELIGLGQFNKTQWPPSKDAAEVIRAMLRDGKLTETADGIALVRESKPADKWLF